MSSEAKREVWVEEQDGAPVGCALLRENINEPYRHLYVRYVPAVEQACAVPASDAEERAYTRGLADGAERERAAVTASFSVLWDWQCRTNAGGVGIPQRLHDGTFRQYAGTPWQTPFCGVGKDVPSCAVDLCAKLGIGRDKSP